MASMKKLQLQKKGLKIPFDYVMDENETSYVYEIDIPGVAHDSVSVTFKNNTLIVQASRNGNQVIDRFNVKRRDIVASAASAEINNGVLLVVVPKRELEDDVVIPVTQPEKID